MASRSSRLPARSSALGRLLSFLGLSALAGLLVAGLMMPAAGATGIVFASGRDMLDELPDQLPAEPVSMPSKIYSADGELIATFFQENRQPVPLDQISPYMRNAIVAIEDERFYQHDGVDAKGLVRAMVNNVSSSSTQGASTLTQQFVNNMLINSQQVRGDSRLTLSGTKQASDKVKEIKLAVAVEKQMSKDQILEGYLNLVLFQGRAYGIEAASQYVFGKPAKDLELWEAATLAGMVQSPTRFNPARNPEGTTARRNTVLKAMLKNGYISQEEHDHAVAQPLTYTMKGQSTGCLSAAFGAYFCDYVERQILADPTFGPDTASRQALLDRGGLTIRTTIDSNLQKKAEELTRRVIPNNESLGAGHSLISLRPGSGDIVTMAQNTEYSIQDELGKTTLNLNVDAKWGGGTGFAAGSTFKPFIGLTWLRNGGKLIDSVDGSKDRYPPDARFQASCLPGGYTTAGGGTQGWQLNNVIDGMKKRDRIDEGIFWSVNTPTVALAYQMDLCDIVNTLTQVGIVTARDGAPLSPAEPSFVLGKDDVSPMTMAGAYATLAANGKYCKPRAITEVTDTTGNQYTVPAPECRQVLDPAQVAEVTPLLRHIAAHNIAPDGTGYEFAGKTGTNNNMSSTWFIGYTTELATAVWAGRYTSQKTMRGETINGVVQKEFYGATVNGGTWLEWNDMAKRTFVPGELPEFDGPQSEDPALEGDHPDGRFYRPEDIDRNGGTPTSSLGPAAGETAFSSAENAAKFESGVLTR
ncbi:penicillin-binding protein [Micrococcus porci]|uniref:transglycosylase domain-containing protein n=1 Tax=Micrococcus porci TaxID=2856555 RepID=UPI001CCC8FD3|nr:transglycosylase domain-containing protein [Micrococcus porci]UBH25522.1 penicillin-binding protein [Micrococcus porci]